MPDHDTLILDEPFTGLDPANQQIVREVIKELKVNNKAILLSTHQMELAERLCDHIILIHQGKIILNDSLNEIKKQHRSDKLEFKITFTNPLESIPHLLDNQTYKNGFLTGKPAKDVSVQDIIAKINKLGLIHSYSSHEPGLEDIFLTLTGENNA